MKPCTIKMASNLKLPAWKVALLMYLSLQILALPAANAFVTHSRTRRVHLNDDKPRTATAMDMSARGTKTRPIVVGTSDYSNILFGKLQRAAAIFGTNIGPPISIVSDELSEGKKLNKFLWNSFCMADSGPDGILEEEDLLRPLSPWIPQADIRGDLIFVDAVSSLEDSKETSESGGLFGFFGMGKKKESSPPSKREDKGDADANPINEKIIACAAERGCDHVFVLVDESSLQACKEILRKYSDNLPSTIMCLGSPQTKTSAFKSSTSMHPTKGWQSSRPQDMEGEMIGPVTISKMIEVDENDNIDDQKASKSIEKTAKLNELPAEDVAEVMLQISLRTDRYVPPEESPRMVCISPGSGNDNSDSDGLEERLNADYFTRTGGEQARKLAGNVQTVSSWPILLSSLGYVNGELGKRKDI